MTRRRDHPRPNFCLRRPFLVFCHYFLVASGVGGYYLFEHSPRNLTLYLGIPPSLLSSLPTLTPPPLSSPAASLGLFRGDPPALSMMTMVLLPFLEDFLAPKPLFTSPPPYLSSLFILKILYRLASSYLGNPPALSVTIILNDLETPLPIFPIFLTPKPPLPSLSLSIPISIYS